MNATSVLSSEKIPQMVSEQTDKNQREINFQRHLAKGRRDTPTTACFAPFPGQNPFCWGIRSVPLTAPDRPNPQLLLKKRRKNSAKQARKGTYVDFEPLEKRAQKRPFEAGAGVVNANETAIHTRIHRN